MNIACSFVPFVNTDCIHLISKTDISNLRLQSDCWFTYTGCWSTFTLMVGLLVH